ncbi:MAG TPA: MMPL family transporter, partial [Polyangiaceae bacterium]
MRETFRRTIGGVVDASGRHPLVVLFIAFLVLTGSWHYAYTHFQLNSDLLELLPRDSPGFKAYEHQLGRVGGGASLIVVVESPDRKANEQFIDTLAAQLDAEQKVHESCTKKCIPTDGACLAGCGPDLVAYVESGTKDVRKFFQDQKWLYADLDDLQQADAKLEREIAIRSGMVEDLESPDLPPAPAPGATATANVPPAPAAHGAKDLGLDEFYDRWQAKGRQHDDFPTGYFATEDGTQLGLRIVSQTRGLGDAGGDSLYGRVRTMVDQIAAKSPHPGMEIGYAGDIPNAIEEKDSLLSDAAWATGGAFVLIFLGIVIFFRSVWAPLVIALPAAIGVGVAYSFAMWNYGFVNTSGAFLGAIILGNGINYPIVLLHRYREFRARGMEPELARREAVLNAFRAELVGSLVASIAYGSLVVTHFRGFNQF